MFYHCVFIIFAWLKKKKRKKEKKKKKQSAVILPILRCIFPVEGQQHKVSILASVRVNLLLN